MDVQAQFPYPHARASIIDDNITLVEWDPRLKPLAGVALEAASPAVFAEVRPAGTPGFREAIITYAGSTPSVRHGDERFRRWAQEVGLRRLWLPDAVIELENTVLPDRTAHVTCPVCLTEISACGAEFWIGVQASGLFPSKCASCGGCIPQWSVEDSVSKGNR